MKRQDAIQQLSEIQYNIESTDKKINAINTSGYYNAWTFGGGESKRKRDLEIQNKCLQYWKRRFNRISFKLMYNL